jgi:hypothetical protein
LDLEKAEKAEIGDMEILKPKDTEYMSEELGVKPP